MIKFNSMQEASQSTIFQSSPAKREIYDDKLMNKLKQMNALADYFYVIGVNEADVVSLIKNNLRQEILLPELKKLQPSIISRFPENDQQRLPLDISIEHSLISVTIIYQFNMNCSVLFLQVTKSLKQKPKNYLINCL